MSNKGEREMKNTAKKASLILSIYQAKTGNFFTWTADLVRFEDGQIVEGHLALFQGFHFRDDLQKVLDEIWTDNGTPLLPVDAASESIQAKEIEEWRGGGESTASIMRNEFSQEAN